MTTPLTSEPRIVERPARPYVAVRDSVSMSNIAAIADRLPEVFGWVARHGLEPTDAPFFRYETIDMDAELVIEAGVPLSDPVEGDDTVLAGVLPAGRYATVTHVGHPSGLFDATAALLAWAQSEGLAWDVADSEHGQQWGCRLEIYRTDPNVEPDMNRWETDLEFRLAG